MVGKRLKRRYMLFGMGVIGTLIALALMAALAAVLLWSNTDEKSPRPTAAPTAPVDTPLGIAAVDFATATPFPTPPPQPTIPPLDWIRPTAAAQEIAAALNDTVVDASLTDTIQRQTDPLTILPLRSRSTVITYAVKSGDTLRTIAEKFGIEQNTIIWSNDRFYVNAMRVGMELTIPPVNGVYHHVQDPQTVAEIAQSYEVDPYVIIDSEYNALFGATPQTILPEGLYVVVPGGTGSTEPIYWDPGIVMKTSDDFTTDGSNPVGAGIRTGGETASFAVGDPGSCGEQTVSGGSPPTGAPIWDKYTITQDYTWNHSGIDLAVPEGTRVYSAGSGTVIFSGWSTWGYGYTVVIAHGSTLTIYGHLNGSFVGCGQVVSAQQNIAVTGTSGRSSGPHLHFEIRGPGGVPVNPWDYQSF
jgi:murein DD-endopeptidase MepM/ murein hydrolase activator NlpD